jgi:hypothetical protein
MGWRTLAIRLWDSRNGVKRKMHDPFEKKLAMPKEARRKLL